jgi:hypothetical protein
VGGLPAALDPSFGERCTSSSGFVQFLHQAGMKRGVAKNLAGGSVKNNALNWKELLLAWQGLAWEMLLRPAHERNY